MTIVKLIWSPNFSKFACFSCPGSISHAVNSTQLLLHCMIFLTAHHCKMSFLQTQSCCFQEEVSKYSEKLGPKRRLLLPRMTVQGINPGIQDPLKVANRKSSYFREGRYSTCLEKRKTKTAARPCTATTRCGWRLKFMGKPTWNEWKLDKMMDMKWYVWCSIVWFTVNIVPCISCTTRLYDVDIFGVSF